MEKVTAPKVEITISVLGITPVLFRVSPAQPVPEVEAEDDFYALRSAQSSELHIGT